MACELVGVAGFEPAASSSRTKDGQQAGGTGDAVTSGSMSQGTTSHPTEIPATDASVTHAAELARLREENAALRGLLATIRDAADSAPQSVCKDQPRWLDRMMFLLTDIEGAARGVTRDGHSAAVCAKVLAEGTMAKPVAYRVYEDDGGRS